MLLLLLGVIIGAALEHKRNTIIDACDKWITSVRKWLASLREVHPAPPPTNNYRVPSDNKFGPP